MGEGLDQMFEKISSSRAEDEGEIGESSDHDSSSSDELASASPPNSCHVALATLLPAKGGLSKFYQGKSQSFSSFSEVTCVEDLAKTPTIRRKMKPSMSYANGLLHIETNINYSSCDQKKVPKVSSCASSIARTSSRNCKPLLGMSLLDDCKDDLYAENLRNRITWML